MAVSLAIRPRSQAERAALAEALITAPSTVGIAHDDDGWATAALTLSGRRVTWHTSASPEQASRLLSSLGLPELAFGRAKVTVDQRLNLQGRAPAGLLPLPPVEGPLVSVVIPTLDRLPLLKQAIDSARGQSWPVEILVVDDGSSDGTWRWLQSQPDLRAFGHNRNRGKSQALQTGVENARGEYLLALDDDDLLLPGAVQALATTLQSCEDLIGVFGDAVFFKGHDIHSYRPALRLPPQVLRRAALAQIPGMGGAFLAHRSAYLQAGPFDRRLGRGADLDMFQRILKLGDVEALPLPTLYYRVRSGQDKPGRLRRASEQLRPVFLERWRQSREELERAEGFSWALGLHQRGLTQEAHMELARWPLPDTPTESWARSHIGATTRPAPTEGRLVVVDDGDPGALEACLHKHSRREWALWVDLEVPRDPIGEVRLHWDGEYGAREPLHTWIQGEGPIHLRLSSSPEWTPPAIDDPALLPPVPPSEAVLLLAAAMDWPLPTMLRRGLGPMSQLSWQAWRARRWLRKAEPRKALSALGPMLDALPEWAPGWAMAAQAFEQLGLRADARACRTRELLHQVA